MEKKVKSMEGKKEGEKRNLKKKNQNFGQLRMNISHLDLFKMNITDLMYNEY